MSWYKINYACDHSDRMQIYGPTRDRQGIANREGRKDCPDCWRKKQDERNAQAALSASADAAAIGLPILTGSEKQILWAETIRQKMLNEFAPLADAKIGKRKQVAELGIVGVDDARWQMLDDATTAQIAGYRSQSSAKWWIDHRFDNLYSLLMTKMGEMAKSLFAVEIAAHESARKATLEAAATESKAAREHELTLARLEKNASEAVSEAAAAQFIPIHVERLNGQDVRITGEDNHIAMAYRQDGETVVYKIDDIEISTMLPNAEALNRRIHQMVPKR